MLATQRNTGPARRGVEGLHKSSTTRASEKREYEEAELGGITRGSRMLMKKQRLLCAGEPQAEWRDIDEEKLHSLLSRKEEQTEEDAGNAEEFGNFFF